MSLDKEGGLPLTLHDVGGDEDYVQNDDDDNVVNVSGPALALNNVGDDHLLKKFCLVSL